MATDFAGHQLQARRATALLLVVFAGTVFLKILAYYAVVAFPAALDTYRPDQGIAPGAWWNPGLFAQTAAVLLAVTAAGTLARLHSLRGGGPALAVQLGGRRVSPATADPAERRLVNVVQESALASGARVPELFILDDEPSINAFAAGFTPDDSAIGVTRGTLDRLTRDELQGVIAHEFSHIVNGDMRLNLILVGVLHGLRTVGHLGGALVRSALSDPRRDVVRFGSTTDRRDEMSAEVGKLFLFAAGAVLVVADSVGIALSHVVRCMLSRQREFLADASAVQFTRNPAGIAGALKKIGGWSSAPRLASAWAAESSHLMFGGRARPARETIARAVGNLLSTHPSLDERIRRIEPDFDGTFSEAGEIPPALADAEGVSRAAGATPRPSASSGDDPLNAAARALAAIPENLRRAAEEPFSARAVVFSLLLDRDLLVRSVQVRAAGREVESAVVEAALALAPSTGGLAPELRLPLIDLSLPALRGMSPEQHERFAAALRAMAGADDRLSLFEFCLLRVVERNLASARGRGGTLRMTRPSSEQTAADAAVVLAAAARAGRGDEAAARSAYVAARTALEDATRAALPADLLPVSACGLDAADRALDRLAGVEPSFRKALLDAVGRAVLAGGGGRVAPELLRAVAAAVGG